jgi:hypothetical protein
MVNTDIWRRKNSKKLEKKEYIWSIILIYGEENTSVNVSTLKYKNKSKS